MVTATPPIYDWQVWAVYDDYRGVHTLRCPNKEGVMLEHADKEYAMNRVINEVAGYINQCKNESREVDLIPNDQLPQPPSWFEVIHKHSQ